MVTHLRFSFLNKSVFFFLTLLHSDWTLANLSANLSIANSIHSLTGSTLVSLHSDIWILGIHTPFCYTSVSFPPEAKRDDFVSVAAVDFGSNFGLIEPWRVFSLSTKQQRRKKTHKTKRLLVFISCIAPILLLVRTFFVLFFFSFFVPHAALNHPSLNVYKKSLGKLFG